MNYRLPTFTTQHPKRTQARTIHWHSSKLAYSQTLYFLFKVPRAWVFIDTLASSPMFLKRTKRKIKQRLCTGDVYTGKCINGSAHAAVFIWATKGHRETGDYIVRQTSHCYSLDSRIRWRSDSIRLLWHLPASLQQPCSSHSQPYVLACLTMCKGRNHRIAARA